MSEPAAIVAAVETGSLLRRTACGAGSMVWHVWGTGPALALFHGGYGSWTHWIRNVERLARDRRVLAADLPGLGDSDLPPEPYTAPSIAAIAAAGLRSLLDPGESVDIAGFSFGGVIGGHVAELLGPPVRNLVLSGSGGIGIPRHAKIELINWRGLSDAHAQRNAHRENLAILMFADPDNIDPLAVHLQVLNAQRARTKSRPLSRMPSLLVALPRMKARLHGIWGGSDITAHGTLGEHARVLRSLRPDASFTVIERAGHWVQYEAADRYNDALTAVLSQN